MGKAPLQQIPDRRMIELAKLAAAKEAVDEETAGLGHLAYPVWRCKVCGYLCARDEAPAVCPICKVKADRFERFI